LTSGQKKQRWNELFIPAPVWASKRDDLAWLACALQASPAGSLT